MKQGNPSLQIDPFCRISAVLFDFDGTLTRPGALDFTAIRQAVGCPAAAPLIEFIETLGTAEARSRANAILDAHEMAAAAVSEPAPGAEALVGSLRKRRVPCGILTRNSTRAVRRALENFPAIGAHDFTIIIARETAVAPKPSGDGVHLAAAHFGVPVEEVLMVGDFVFDTRAGLQAGSRTAHVGPSPPAGCHYSVATLAELWDLIHLSLPLAVGKLPNDLLERFLEDFQRIDPSLIVRPEVGQDTAALDLGGADTLVVTGDPITFATDRIGRYAVWVNANDMATSGADPRWFLTTLLFPCKTTAGEVRRVMADLAAICRAHRIIVCGGHTEITDAVTRPVINGTMIGTLMRGHLIDKRNIACGDRLLITKALAVEGTALIAREFAAVLRRRGLSEEVLRQARHLLEQIGILEDAAICRAQAGVSALHDVTEGGLATAARELARAGRCGLRLFADRIPVYEETRWICDLMGIDPRGLIGSGSLLICCRPAAADNLARRLKAAGIQATAIGEVISAEDGIQAESGGHPVEWPDFEVDEITRLFSDPSANA